MFSEIFDVFIDGKLLITFTRGDNCILEEFTARDFSDVIF